MNRLLLSALLVLTGATHVQAQLNPAEPEMRALANFCQALLSVNAFLYVD